MMLQKYSPTKKGVMVFDNQGDYCLVDEAYDFAKQERLYERQKNNDIFDFICDCVRNGNFVVKNGGVRFGVAKKTKKRARKR